MNTLAYIKLNRPIIPISDVDLLSEIQDLFNSIITNPELITPSDSENQISIKTQRAENEINRLFDSRNPNKDQIRGKLIEAVSLKYGDIDTAKYESQFSVCSTLYQYAARSESYCLPIR